MTRYRPSRSTRSGYTLLELVLSLALSVLVLYAVVWSIQLHLSSLDIRRTSIEEAQVGRALLKIISDDLRGALQHREQDYSGVEDVLANALSAAAEEIALEAGLLEDLIGGEGGGEDGEPPAGDAGDGGGDAGDTGDLGGDAAEEDAAVEDEVTDLSYTENIADGGLIPPVIGIYGNANQIQIDVSRVQRFDELYTATAASAGVMPSSDVQTTSYYIRGAGIGGVGQTAAGAVGSIAQRSVGGAGPLGSGMPFDPFGATTGLIRRQVSRSKAIYESNAGGAIGGSFDGSTREEIIAPECVAIQFEYYDGFEWAAEWDSLLKGGLPFAVAVQVTLQSHTRVDPYMDPNEPPELMVFRQVISIPTAEPITPAEEQETLEELQGTETTE